MSRHTRERNVRRDPSLRDGARPVQLQESRRFFTSQGNDKANREARALQNLFGAGVDLAETITDKRNVEGANEAAFENAAGGTRGSENTTRGYNEMWDEIEASNDLHLFSKELPELLRGADWENLTEEEAQGVIDGYFQDQLKGINPQSVYGQRMAEGILKQNAQLLDTHRNFQIQRIQQEQRVMIYNEALATFETDGVVDYDTIASRTGVAFDGAEKMTTFWEVIYDLAVDAGDETIIEQVPERFPSGDPTGINDPKLLAEHNTAIARARAVRERQESDAARAAAAQRAAAREQGNLALMELVVEGTDPLATAMDFARNGVIEAGDVTTAATAYRNIRDDRAKTGFDPSRVALLQTQSALDPRHDMLSPSNLMLDWSEGVFGPPESPQARTAFRQMLQDVERARETRERVSSDPAKRTWTNRFDESFPVPKDQFGIPVAGALTELRAAYSAEFELAIANASPEQYRELYTQFADEYRKAENLTQAVESSRTPEAVIRNIVQGNFTPEQGIAQMRQLGIGAQQLSQARSDGAFGDPDALPGTPQGEAYRALLQGLLEE